MVAAEDLAVVGAEAALAGEADSGDSVAVRPEAAERAEAGEAEPQPRRTEGMILLPCADTHTFEEKL